MNRLTPLRLRFGFNNRLDIRRLEDREIQDQARRTEHLKIGATQRRLAAAGHTRRPEHILREATE